MTEPKRLTEADAQKLANSYEVEKGYCLARAIKCPTPSKDKNSITNENCKDCKAVWRPE